MAVWLFASKKNNRRVSVEESKAHCHNDLNKPKIGIFNYSSNPVGVIITYSVEELNSFSLQESMLHYLWEHSTFSFIL